MTETKLMMVNRDNNKVHEFIKEKFVRQHEELDMSSSSLYNEFKNWFQEYVNPRKKPLTVQEFTRSLGSLGLKAKCKRVGDRTANKKMQWYSATYNVLYTTFMKKNMIDEAKNIEKSEGYQQSEVLITVPTEILLAEDHLKTSIKSSNPESIVIQSQEEIVPPADITKEKEEYGVPGPSSDTSEKSELTSKEYIDQKLEDLYTSAKGAWKRDDQDPNEFDWETFAIEIEDLPNHDTNNLKDWYYWDVGQIVCFYLNKTNKIMDVNHQNCDEIAQKIQQYEKKRGTLHIPAPVPFAQVISANMLPKCPKPNEKEYWQAEGYDDIDDEDEELEDLWDPNLMKKKISKPKVITI
ncbi:hypothetical protein C1645_745386 [Glomus cerebriforme]|uniref:Uncharacterized protein n=1 Tax=Glomus cerebriforme TaxID=658196 RepID=A0A397S422_9GLOM|nr:hypothetical protein C1645_745386 [Glomus cerebriforme]